MPRTRAERDAIVLRLDYTTNQPAPRERPRFRAPPTWDQRAGRLSTGQLCKCGALKVRCDECAEMYCAAPGHSGHVCKAPEVQP